MEKDISKLLRKIDSKEDVKVEMNNLDEELNQLRLAVTNLQSCITKLDQADKDSVAMVKAMDAASDSMDMAVFAFCRAVTRAESTVLKVEMTDECKREILKAREKLVKAEEALLSTHRDLMLQQLQSQNEELQSFIRSGKGVYLSPRIFWWWMGISYAAALYSFWNLLQLLVQWWKA